MPSMRVAVAFFMALLAAVPVPGRAGPADAAPPLPSAPAPSFFNTVETRSSDLSAFNKWTGMLERFTKEAAEAQKGGCESKKFTKCHYDDWSAFLRGQLDQDRQTQMIEVNRFMNKAKYTEDEPNWGQKDFWSTPGEFFSKYGDCEDYAIAKFISLLKLGFKPDQLRVVAVQDLNLKIGHAVLVVFLDGKTWLLDNQIPQAVEAKTVRHYQPIFSINTQAWWRHRPA
ncbi:MAG: transglutaminase-like cysteine peptidase [Magnetospirillum sp. WYHS-4]